MLHLRLALISVLFFVPLLSACQLAPAAEERGSVYPKPVALKSPPKLPVQDTEFKRASVARSADAFTTEHQVFSGKAVPGGVDFDTERVAAVRVMHTSGSNRVVDLRVRETKDAYYVTYEVKRPRIGTTDIRFVDAYAVLPANQKAVWFAERGGKQGVKKVPGRTIQIQTGLLRRAAWATHAE